MALAINIPRHQSIDLSQPSSFEELISELFHGLLSAPESEIDAAIENAIRRIVESLGLDHGILFQWSNDTRRQVLTHSTTTSRSLFNPAKSDEAPVPWIVQQAREGEIVAVASLAELPADGTRDRVFLRKAGITALLSVPLRIGGRVIGAMILAGNTLPMEWRQEVVRWIRVTADLIAGLLDRTGRITELEEQLRFNALLARVAGKLDDLPIDKIDAGIEDVQRIVCESLRLDRSALYQFSLDRSDLLLTHLYQPEGEPPTQARMSPDFPFSTYWVRTAGGGNEWARMQLLDHFPWSCEQVCEGRAIVMSSLDDLPEEAAVDRSSFKRFGTQSSVVIPLLIEGAPIGCLTFATMRKARAWPEHLVKSFRFISDVFASALARKSAERFRLRAENRFRAITNHLPVAVYQFYARDDGDLGLYYVEPRCLDLIGVDAEPLDTFLHRVSYCIPPEDRGRWRASIEQAIHRQGPWNCEGRYIKPDGKEIYLRCFSHPRRIGDELVFDGMLLDITDRKRAEDELRESERKFRRLHESMRDAFASVDMQSRFLDSNVAFQNLLGYSAEELRELTVFDITPEEWRDQELRIDREQLVTRGYTDVYEKQLRRKDGTVFPVELRSLLIKDDSGQPTAVWSIIRDITDRRRSEETLLQRNRYIETVLENAPIGFAVHTIDDGIARFVSARFEEICGVPRGTIDSHDAFFEKVWPNHPEFRQQFKTRVLADEASGDPGRMHWEEVPIFLPSGETRFISGLNIPLPDQNMMVIAVQDVTDRVRAQKAHQEVDLRFRQVAESVSDFIWEVDARGLYTYTSPAVEKILGYRPEELVGKVHLYDLFTADTREKLKAAALVAFSLKKPLRAFPNPNVKKSGEVVHLETSGVPMLDEAGKLLGYRGAHTDVSERKRSEAELRRTLDQLKELEARLRQENVILRREVAVQTQILGRGMQPALNEAEQVAPTDSTVLILGETGTGKGLLAQHIHRISGRRSAPLTTINIAALPASLMESELFGHERGAFTGALAKRIGRFEIAHNGTIFLDEIGEMPLETQAKLLRVLQDGELERLGSSQTIKVNVRVLAATNRDLAKLVKEGKFREDLYYRLNVFPIQLPPLREHPEDIPMLVQTFVNEHAVSMGKPIEQIHRKELDALLAYEWPGNVRELRNVVERSMILTQGRVLYLAAPKAAVDENITESRRLDDMERIHVARVLASTHGRVGGSGGAAQILGLKPSTLFSLMKRLNIPRQPEQRSHASQKV